MPESTPYFMDHINRIAANEYIPTDQDILWLNSQSIFGGDFERYALRTRLICMFDSNGQIRERRRWYRIFGKKSVVIFVASLNHYDKVLVEDNSINAMDDSIALFSQIINREWFMDKYTILLLNKTDLFKKKIHMTPITVCASLAGYTGDATDYEEARTYIKDVFEQQNRTGKEIITHFVSAIDSIESHNILSKCIQTMCQC